MQSRRHGGALVGLVPPNKAPCPLNRNMKHYKSVKFLSIFRMSSPHAQTQSPLLKTFWRRFCFTSRDGTGIIKEYNTYSKEVASIEAKMNKSRVNCISKFKKHLLLSDSTYNKRSQECTRGISLANARPSSLLQFHAVKAIMRRPMGWVASTPAFTISMWQYTVVLQGNMKDMSHRGKNRKIEHSKPLVCFFPSTADIKPTEKHVASTTKFSKT